jgi:phosphoglycerol transferase MdoB-like AlkP superfamily enzyme
MDSTLLNNYHNLMEERIMLENVIMKNNTLNAAYNDSTIIVTARYYEYVALLFTSILLIMLFFRFNTSGVQSGGSGCNYNITILKVLLIVIFIIFYSNRSYFNTFKTL